MKIYAWRVLILSIFFCLAIYGCDKPDQDDKKVKRIAIATLMSHPALDEVQNNVIETLAKNGFVAGDNVEFLIKNANGQVQLAANIAQDLATQNPDVIVAITTPMAQAVAKIAKGPVVFAAVTDPVGAGLVEALDKPAVNITGTSDAWPYKDQLLLIKEINPDLKTLGVLYNPGEAASSYGIEQIKKYAAEMGIQLELGGVSSTTEVYPVARSLVNNVDALFLSSDNTVIGGVASAAKTAIEAQVPLYVGDSGTVEKGGMAAVSVGYSQLGIETGKLVVKMLNGDRSIPVVVARGTNVVLNTKAAEMMGVKIPESVLKRATTIHTEIK